METWSLLRSPHSQAMLVQEAERSTCLQDEETGARFPIREGVPVFVEQVSGQNLRYQRLYDAFAPLYDLSQRLAYQFFGGEEKVRKELLEPLGIRPGERVLEVSVGTGGNWRWLPEGVSLYGIDLSWGQLSQCRKNLARWKREAVLCQAEAEHLPFASESFDAVIHLGGINFFNDPAQAVGEMIRVAKPGARILIADESEAMASWGERVPGMRRFYREREAIVPETLLPEGMEDVQLRYHLRNQLYALTFKKP